MLLHSAPQKDKFVLDGQFQNTIILQRQTWTREDISKQSYKLNIVILPHAQEKQLPWGSFPLLKKTHGPVLSGGQIMQKNASRSSTAALIFFRWLQKEEEKVRDNTSINRDVPIRCVAKKSSSTQLVDPCLIVY